jgi:tetratricopeptide (TPR) repeat protein
MAERQGAVDVQADALATYGVLPDLPLEEKLDALEKAVEIAETAGLWYIASRAHNNLGVVIKDLRDSRDHFMQSFELSRKIGYHETSSLENALLTSLQLGELESVEEALPELEQEISRISDLGDIEPYPNTTRIILMMSRGQWTDALDLLRKMHHYSSERGDLLRIFGASTGIAEILIELNRLGELNDLGKAEASLGTAVEIADRGLRDRAEPRCQLSIVYARQGRFKDARQLLTEVLEMAGPEPTIRDKVGMKSAQAELAYLEERWSESIAAYEAAASIYTQMEMLPMWARTLMLWADVYIARGEPGDNERAVELLRQAQEAYQDMEILYWIDIVEGKLAALGAEP